VIEINFIALALFASNDARLNPRTERPFLDARRSRPIMHIRRCVENGKSMDGFFPTG